VVVVILLELSSVHIIVSLLNADVRTFVRETMESAVHSAIHEWAFQLSTWPYLCRAVLLLVRVTNRMVDTKNILCV
jgi:hypothetical protein